MDVSIIIINWNSKDYLRKCLATLKSVSPGLDAEIIVLDNASHDGCGEMLNREFPGVIFIQSDKNLGFAKGNNVGASRAKGRYLLFLNPDTELVEDSVSILRSRLDSLPGAGAAGCRLVNADGSLQSNSVMAFPNVLNQVLDSEYFRRTFPTWGVWGSAALYSPCLSPSVVDAVSGACIMIDRDLFRSVGGFTEEYFMYAEEVDLCLKVRRSGRHVYYIPETSVIHYGGGSSRKAKSSFATVMMQESVHRFMRLNRGRLAAAGFRLAQCACSLVRIFLILCLLPFDRSGVVRHGSGSLRKWYSILRWALGLESWVRNYCKL
jgi:GT2 family glycosyltransferase